MLGISKVIRSTISRASALLLLAIGLTLAPPPKPAAAAIGVTTADELSDAFLTGGDIVLEADITIPSSGPDLTIGPDESVELDLGGHRLEVTGQDGRAGVTVPAGTSLTVVDPTGGGALSAIGGRGGAGIGGDHSEAAGTITIDGSTVIATSDGAGIGGGSALHQSGSVSGAVNIVSGTVIAVSTGDGAGIGGRANHDGLEVTIGADATVEVSSTAGPAIGGGGGVTAFGSLSNAGTLILTRRRPHRRARQNRRRQLRPDPR